MPNDEEDNDPLEPANRVVYRFNEDLDTAFLKPISEGYIKITPPQVRTSIANFFDNTTYINIILNDLLQGKGRQALNDAGRFTVNTTFGIFGLFDVATKLGLERHEEDLGQTLGVWGFGEGAYLVLPLFGPNSIRDGPGLYVAFLTNPIIRTGSAGIIIPLSVLAIIDARARASRFFSFINEAALDPYIFTREAYRQKREYLIHDGNPPPEKSPDGFEEGEFFGPQYGRMRNDGG